MQITDSFKSRSGTVLMATLVIFAVPVGLCAIDLFVIDFQIGAAVLFYPIIVLVASPLLYTWWLAEIWSDGVAFLASIPLSLLSATLVLNLFIGMTFLFGVKDFDLM